MSANPEPEHASREKEWKGMKSYHEHLQLAAQDRSAKMTSAWLAEKIIKPLNPRSILEVGCGSGRNLRYIQKYIPQTKIFGIDINEDAINIAKKELGSVDASLTATSLYDLGRFKDNSIDVVFTSGVLMHVPHEKAPGVVREMHRIARYAVVHFELDGPSHDFDFHRYPRHYDELYKKIGIGITSYEVYPRSDFRSSSAAVSSFNHALLISML
jgi:S-adenosylmethionine-diacylgycerolhomoserine-N-methlytransferase